MKGIKLDVAGEQKQEIIWSREGTYNEFHMFPKRSEYLQKPAKTGAKLTTLPKNHLHSLHSSNTMLK